MNQLKLVSLLGAALFLAPAAVHGWSSALAGHPAGSAQQGAAGALTPAVIGVVDLEKVAGGYKRAEELQGEYRREAEGLEAELRERAKTLDGLKADRDALEKGTRAWIEADIKHRSLIGQLEMAKERYEGYLRERQYRTLTLIYDDVRAAIAQVATQRGIDVVLRLRGNESGDKAPLGQVLRDQESREVLYSSPKLDLTEDVIRILRTAPAK
ncbi:MAG: OmpH family outer membrane protein [Planctomycetes bacterium]|nr:OmpH family outer membrane protein [Planctomycetota bacterium]